MLQTLKSNHLKIANKQTDSHLNESRTEPTQVDGALDLGCGTVAYNCYHKLNIQ